MKHYVKPTQEKQPAQIIIYADTNDLPDNKNSEEISNEIVEFANSIKTSKNNRVVPSIVKRENRFTNKAEEVNGNLKDICEEHNLPLIQHHNINSFRHTNAKGMHLNSYGDKQLTRRLLLLLLLSIYLKLINYIYTVRKKHISTCKTFSKLIHFN